MVVESKPKVMEENEFEYPDMSIFKVFFGIFGLSGIQPGQHGEPSETWRNSDDLSFAKSCWIKTPLKAVDWALYRRSQEGSVEKNMSSSIEVRHFFAFFGQSAIRPTQNKTSMIVQLHSSAQIKRDWNLDRRSQDCSSGERRVWKKGWNNHKGCLWNFQSLMVLMQEQKRQFFNGKVCHKFYGLLLWIAFVKKSRV